MTQSISMIQDTIIYIQFQENKKLKQIKRYFHIFHIHFYNVFPDVHQKNSYFCLLFAIYFSIFIFIIIKKCIQKKAI